jgi:peptidyl-tRNA hydrolase, PTH1 family
MLLIVGLGNPGKEYANTRHNFGFMVLDQLAQNYNLTFPLEPKFRGEVAELSGHKHSPEKVIFLKPQTFMNLSGESVGSLVRFYKIDPKSIWVVVDDLDIPLGKIRVRTGGETGGHHGLDSIVQVIGTGEFKRIRLGIRGSEIREEHRERRVDTRSFVTSPFAASDMPMLQKVIQTTANIIKEGIETGDLVARTIEVDGLDEQIGVA